jgi:hypothetical protein
MRPKSGYASIDVMGQKQTHALQQDNLLDHLVSPEDQSRPCRSVRASRGHIANVLVSVII